MVKLHKHTEPEIVPETDMDEDLSVHIGTESNEHIDPESDKNDDKVYFMALGGLEHVGQNMYLYKYKGNLLLLIAVWVF